MVVSMLTVAAVSAGAADSSGTTTITVGVINYVINELGNTGYKVHYWGGADGAKDADLTATGKTEKKSVGKAYWNGDEQTFTMFTATVPSGFDGYKVHNGDRWFGDDGTPDKTTAYIFNYSGDKALYEVSAEPVTEPVTVAPATDAPAEMAYYLVGSVNEWTAEDAYKLSKNDASADIEEYLFNDLALETTDEFKVVYSEDGTAMTKWFPEGSDNNYGGNGEITAAGTYILYFRPHYDGFEDWFNGCIAVINNSEPQLLLGDVDMDGDVDIQDATLLQSCLIEAKTLTDEQFKLADVNQDGVVNVRDVTAIQRIVAEMS
ncbi:MAG: dockerin type I repeat-containing protein [Ruminococcus sp.]|nr:dockerin type I repeat-containing protein [Ruminococcus sp.]